MTEFAASARKMPGGVYALGLPLKSLFQDRPQMNADHRSNQHGCVRYSE
jgi:hypothetical protein